jgi:putative phosphoesterase
MRVAALYDVHGNLPALEAALVEVERLGEDLVLVGGDVAWGPLPRETVARLDALGERARFIRGNADREVAARAGVRDGLDEATARINLWCADQLSDAQRAWLGRWPSSQLLDIEGLGAVLFCHGSPRSDEETITAATSSESLAAMLAGVQQEVIVCGHTHAQFERTDAGVRVVNAGSVGLPFGRQGAYWALLGPDVELRRSDYDVEVAARRFLEVGGPGAHDFAEHVLAPPPTEAAAELFTRA